MDSVVPPRAVRGSRSPIATTARLAGGGGRRAGAVELLRRSHRCTRHSGSHRCVLVADAAGAAHMVGSRSALASVNRALPVGLHGASDRTPFVPHRSLAAAESARGSRVVQREMGGVHPSTCRPPRGGSAQPTHLGREGRQPGSPRAAAIARVLGCSVWRSWGCGDPYRIATAPPPDALCSCSP